MRTALPIALILAIFAVYVSKHVWQCDDAFISYRYVRNLVMGKGLVFNAGERVEGYTNFSWVLELAACWKLLGTRPEHANYALSGLCTLGTLILTARLARRTPFQGRAQVAVCVALLLLAVNRSFVVWTTSGLETRQFTFLTVLAIWYMQRGPRTPAILRYAPASLAWAAVQLTRPEGSLLYACAGLWLLGVVLARGRVHLAELAGFVLPFVLVVGAHFAFRYAYYGDLLPNTYYAKDVRPWPEAGFLYLTAAVIEHGLYWVVPLAAAGLRARLTRNRDALHLLSALCIAAHAAYLVRIGGDHFEFRPLDFYWPLLSVAAADGLLAIQATVTRLGSKWWRQPRRADAIGWWVAGSATLIVIAYGTVLQLAQITLTQGLHTREETLHLDVQISEENFPAAFAFPAMRTLLAPYNAAIAYTSQHSIGTRYQEHVVFWQEQLKRYGAYIGRTDGLFPPDATMQLGTVGVPSYSFPDLTLIDTLGLNDRTIARNPVTVPNSERQLAHDRRPPPGYLEQRGVNLKVKPSATRFFHNIEYALQLERDVWMPLSSPDSKWLRRAFAPHGLWWKRLDPELARNQVWVSGKALRPRRALGFFDLPDSDWTANGARMFKPGKAPKGYVGGGFVSSLDRRHSDAAQGSLSSPTFTPAAGDYLTFLVSGGASTAVGVELLVGDRVATSWHGDDSDRPALIAADLTQYAGQPCQLRIYDWATGRWGHVAADHFMLLH